MKKTINFLLIIVIIFSMCSCNKTSLIKKAETEPQTVNAVVYDGYLCEKKIDEIEIKIKEYTYYNNIKTGYISMPYNGPIDDRIYEKDPKEGHIFCFIYINIMGERIKDIDKKIDEQKFFLIDQAGNKYFRKMKMEKEISDKLGAKVMEEYDMKMLQKYNVERHDGRLLSDGQIVFEVKKDVKSLKLVYEFDDGEKFEYDLEV